MILYHMVTHMILVQDTKTTTLVPSTEWSTLLLFLTLTSHDQRQYMLISMVVLSRLSV